MARYALKDNPEKPVSEGDTTPTAKTRKCLMCSTTFSSEWSGERICRKCKSSNTWRSA